MKTLLRVFVIALLGQLSPELLAGNLKVTLAPSQAVSAGAQWRVDGGSWRNSGTTANGLSNTSHTVDFKSITGWVTPTSTAATLSGSSTTSLTATYVQTALLKISLTPTSGQWRVDGGSWRASGATVSNLTPGNHAVDYSSVSGYASPAAETITLISGQTTTLARNYTALASLKVTLAPTSGQWRIDAGAWRTSGTTVTGLTPGNHAVDYSTVSGYASPAAETIILISGQTTTLTRSYVQLASLKVTLTPTSGQWRIDAGAWRTGGTTVTGLTPGNHTVDYSAVSGYASPGAEAVALISGQTTTFTRNYTALASLKITLIPASGQWSVDGGGWQASGATVQNLVPGAHTVSYSALAGYAAPASEMATLAAGQLLAFSRGYTQLAQILINLVPATGQWRANGGGWQASGASLAVLPGSYVIEYSALSLYDSPAAENITLAAGGLFAPTRYYTSQKPTLRVNLTPASGQWRVDGGAWQASGALVGELAAGSHGVDYLDLGGIYRPLQSETISLALHQNEILSRAYAEKPASLTINLSPSQGQWRVYPSQSSPTGAWQNNAVTVTGLVAGSYTIEYASVAGYDAPATETVVLSANQSAVVSRTYAPHPAQVTVNLTPSAATWRIYPAPSAPGETWNGSGTVVGGLVPGDYTIEYGSLANHDAPATETVTLSAGQSAVYARAYVPHPAQITVTLTPAYAQWRIYLNNSTPGDTWNSSGTSVGGLAAGTYSLEYASLAGHVAPPTQLLTLGVGEQRAVTAAYQQLASVHVTTTPSWGQWRIDGGQWWPSGSTTINNLLFGVPHTVEFSDVMGYVSPAAQTFTLGVGEQHEVTAVYQQLASVHATTTPSWGQWRIDGGQWWPGGSTTVNNLAFGISHTVEFAELMGYVTPPSQSFILGPGEQREVTATYQQLASVHVTTTPSWGQWRIDGGQWWPGGSTTVNNLAFGVSHTIEFADLMGYVTPTAQTFILGPGEQREVAATYQQFASVYVNFNPSWISAQWRIDGGAWRSAGSSANNLDYGVPHTVEYSTVEGYVAPPSETFTLASGEYRTFTAAYTQKASVYVIFNPSWVSAQWRIDGGAWRSAGSSAYNLDYGVPHTVEYSTVDGYVSPPSATFTLTSGEYRTLTASYSQLASVYVTFDPNWVSAQWRIDGGAWRSAGTSAYNLDYGAPHTIEYSTVDGYVAPPAVTITLAAGEYRTLTATYAPLAYLSISLNLPVAKWRVDGGKWISAGYSAGYLSIGAHTIEYSRHDGYIAPATETISLAGSSTMLSRSYTTDPAFTYNFSLAAVTVNLDPSFAEWRVDGGAWNTSGATLLNQSIGSHTIEYAPLADYISPANDTVTLTAGAGQTLYTRYTSIDPAQLTVTTAPATGQWRVYPYQWPASGAWHVSGETATALNPGPYTIEYSPVNGYDAPSLNYANLLPNEAQSLTADYAPRMFQYKITLVPGTARFRYPGSAWNPSGATTMGHTPGSYTIEFEPVPGYVTPAPATVVFEAGATGQFTFTYTPL